MTVPAELLRKVVLVVLPRHLELALGWHKGYIHPLAKAPDSKCAQWPCLLPLPVWFSVPNLSKCISRLSHRALPRKVLILLKQKLIVRHLNLTSQKRLFHLKSFQKYSTRSTNLNTECKMKIGCQLWFIQTLHSRVCSECCNSSWHMSHAWAEEHRETKSRIQISKIPLEPIVITDTKSEWWGSISLSW